MCRWALASGWFCGCVVGVTGRKQQGEQGVNRSPTMLRRILTNRCEIDSFLPTIGHSRGAIPTGKTSASRPVSRVLSAPPPAKAGTLDDHSSGTSVAGCFSQPTRAAGRKSPGGQAAMPPLFGFAPGGVCRAAPVASRAVRSCRTVSPLPGHAPAVCSLWHYPWGRPRRTLSGTVFPWSPDFPLPRPFGTCGSGHPASWRK